jgi:hypothetical protein
MDDLLDLKRHPRILDLYKSRVKLKRQGKGWRGLCPFHNDKHATNFDVCVSADNGAYVHKCLACGAGGSVIDLLQVTDKVDLREAIQIAREFCTGWEQNKQKVNASFPDRDESKQTTYAISEFAQHEQDLADCPEAREWLLNERGIQYDTAKKLHYGFCWDVGKKAGVGNPLSNKGWIITPSLSLDGSTVLSLKYRSISAKRVESNGTKWSGFCKKGGMASPWCGEESLDLLNPVIVTEGELDRAVLEQAGFRAVSLPNGAESVITPEMRDQIMQNSSRVILAGDTDINGTKAMDKIYRELFDDKLNNVLMVRWPEPYKDASDFFLIGCKRDIELFRKEADFLIQKSLTAPMRGVYDIKQSLLTYEHTTLTDHPERLRFPWKSVDRMAVILPETITVVYSTESGQGKSTWVFQETVFAAQQGEIVLNYQAEMNRHQIDTIFTSHLLRKNRLELAEEDYRQAGKLLGSNFRYYIGRDTSLTTITEVLNLIEAAIKRFGPTIVVLDNLHFLCRNEQDQVKAQANAMQRITNMAGKYRLKFIVVHQARKADQQHKRKVTSAADLDGSKAVQNDASFIFSIHREEIQHKGDDGQEEHEYDPVTEIRLQKAREKGDGQAYTKLLFRGHICTFTDMIDLKETPFASKEKESETIPF